MVKPGLAGRQAAGHGFLRAAAAVSPILAELSDGPRTVEHLAGRSGVAPSARASIAVLAKMGIVTFGQA